MVVVTFMGDEFEIGEIGFEWVGSHHLKRFYREDGLIQISLNERTLIFLNESKEERSQKVLTALKELRTRRRRRFRRHLAPTNPARRRVRRRDVGHAKGFER